MTGYQHIIFDFDGTLADSFQLLIRAANTYAPVFGYRPILDSDISHLRNTSPFVLMRDFRVKPRLLPAIIWKGRRYMLQHSHEITLYPGVEGMIKKLKKEWKKLYIISSSMTELVQKIIAYNGLSEYFVAIQGGGKIFGKEKKIKKLCARYDLDLERTVYIGDEVRDIQACKKITMPIISVTRGYNDQSLLKSQHPTRIVNSLEWLCDLICGEKSAQKLL